MKEESNIISINFRRKKTKTDDKVSDFSERTARIRRSLNEINKLMNDLNQIKEGKGR